MKTSISNEELEVKHLRVTGRYETSASETALNCTEQKRETLSTYVMLFMNGLGGLVARSRPWGRRAPGPKPASTEDPPCMRPAAR
ncbi:hypothetical protein AVEN_5916-1 [Araneus ventricosus]|uniref:Uncharacterized protein n=1 Tax=Araneus ventricosus TaxID=182803 RepID=A0A4Y2EXB5_ARAVE|nr:hypothetical protein AVEN_5916-1 [Araneus ventricosus]